MSDEALNLPQQLLVSRAEATGVHCKPPKEKEEEERREK